MSASPPSTTPATDQPTSEDQLDVSIDMFDAQVLSLTPDLAEETDELAALSSITDAAPDPALIPASNEISPNEADNLQASFISDVSDNSQLVATPTPDSSDELAPAGSGIVASPVSTPSSDLPSDLPSDLSSSPAPETIESAREDTGAAEAHLEPASDPPAAIADGSSAEANPGGHAELHQQPSDAAAASLADSFSNFTILEDITAGGEDTSTPAVSQDNAPTTANPQDSLTGLYDIGGTMNQILTPEVSVAASPPPLSTAEAAEHSALNDVAKNEPKDGSLIEDIGVVGTSPAEATLGGDEAIDPAPGTPVDLSDQVSMMNDMAQLDVTSGGSPKPESAPDEFSVYKLATSTAHQPVTIEKAVDAMELSTTDADHDIQPLIEPNEADGDAAFDILSSLSEPNPLADSPAEPAPAKEEQAQNASPNDPATYIGNMNSINMAAPQVGAAPPATAPSKKLSSFGIGGAEGGASAIALLAKAKSLLQGGVGASPPGLGSLGLLLSSSPLIMFMVKLSAIVLIGGGLWTHRQKLQSILPADLQDQIMQLLNPGAEEYQAEADSTTADTEELASDDEEDFTSTSPPSSSADSTWTSPSHPQHTAVETVSWGAIATDTHNPYLDLTIVQTQKSAAASGRQPLNPWAYPTYQFKAYPASIPDPPIEAVAAAADEPQAINAAPFDPITPDVITTPLYNATPPHQRLALNIITMISQPWSEDEFTRRLQSSKPYHQYELVFYIHHHQQLDKIPTLKSLTEKNQKPWLILYALSVLYDFNAALSVEDIQLATSQIPPRILKNWVKKFQGHHPISKGTLALMRALIRSSNARTRRAIVRSFYHHRHEGGELTRRYIQAAQADPNPFISREAIRMSATL